ncbi:MAG: AAA family ATPase, partial [Lachnospiraceae bacterium]|nr:AAA family ATPase [Lachnospiraceae bacterium]
MAKTICFANQKGGVGKTMSTAAVSVELKNRGFKVLCVDFDPQGNLTTSFGVREAEKLERTVSTELSAIIEDGGSDAKEALIRDLEGVSLLPSNLALSGMEVALVNVMSRETVLKELLSAFKDDFDYILIDCSPSLGMLTINALVAADMVIIPAQPAYLSLIGLQQLIRTIGRVKKSLNPGLDIGGVLLTMVDERTNYTKDIISLLTESYGSKIRIFETHIPYSVRAA